MERRMCIVEAGCVQCTACMATTLETCLSMATHFARGGTSAQAGPTALQHLGGITSQVAALLDVGMVLDVLCFGTEEQLLQPCVDCGLITGNFCETKRQRGHILWQGGYCFVADHLHGSGWAPYQRTPLCTKCERLHGSCRFCRKVHGCTPPAHRGERQDGRVS